MQGVMLENGLILPCLHLPVSCSPQGPPCCRESCGEVSSSWGILSLFHPFFWGIEDLHRNSHFPVFCFSSFPGSRALYCVCGGGDDSASGCKALWLYLWHSDISRARNSTQHDFPRGLLVVALCTVGAMVKLLWRQNILNSLINKIKKLF